MYTNDPFEEAAYEEGGHPATKTDLIKDMLLEWEPGLILFKLSLTGPFHMSRLDKSNHLFAFTPEEARLLANTLLDMTDTMGADFLERSGVHE